MLTRRSALSWLAGIPVAFAAFVDPVRAGTIARIRERHANPPAPGIQMPHTPGSTVCGPARYCVLAPPLIDSDGFIRITRPVLKAFGPLS